jgi:hypothetical protein
MEFYKKLIDEINKVRKDPKAFAEKLLSYKQYFEGNYLVLPGSDAKVETQEGFKAYEEAANILNGTDPLPELSPSKGLGKIASDFFEKIKETDPDHIGDIDLNSLIAKYGSFSGVFENIIEFGNNSPELIVTNCIVCDGNPDRENRNILLSKDLLKVGMAFGSHVTYGYCTIIISCTEFKNVDNSDDLEVYGDATPTPDAGAGAGADNATGKPPETPAQQTSEPPKDTSPNAVGEALARKYEETDDFVCNDPDVISWERRERLCIERGKRKRKIIYFKKYKNGKIKKEVKYIVL